MKKLLRRNHNCLDFLCIEHWSVWASKDPLTSKDRLGSVVATITLLPNLRTGMYERPGSFASLYDDYLKAKPRTVQVDVGRTSQARRSDTSESHNITQNERQVFNIWSEGFQGTQSSSGFDRTVCSEFVSI